METRTSQYAPEIVAFFSTLQTLAHLIQDSEPQERITAAREDHADAHDRAVTLLSREEGVSKEIASEGLRAYYKHFIPSETKE